ncbi:LirA/MavJ family T4SS effector [Plastoroseomonas hellenica]|uniref:LirA/MavJ family T4SS effector n=1 Tax=Plastoroseomonas hellenica TaxID=2687306 RepID=UPI001BAD3C5E|nr:LirA/MavJ family T4SS effector [Plastoroseomonas hellenica]MBR0641533.1 hypothetical protein [Plastoroseomonas hellenica]
MANGEKWDRGADFQAARYPGLAYRDCYSRIHGFLREEQNIRKALEALQIATNGMDGKRFQAYLAAEEQRFGFSRTLGVIPAGPLLSPNAFWGYLMRGEPLVDHSASDAGGHGVLTHRVQWVLLGQWNERTASLRTPTPTLYRNLADPNARALRGPGKSGPIFDSVWDELFDSEEWNATSPEQSFGYAKRHYPGLRSRWEWSP